MRTLLVPLLAAGLALVALAPAASAGPVSCGAWTDTIVVTYHCTVVGVGAAGAVYTCPNDPMIYCESGWYCAAEASPIMLGCNFP